MKNKTIKPIVTLVIIGSTGFLAGKYSNSDTSPSTESSTSIGKSIPSNARPARRSHSSSTGATNRSQVKSVAVALAEPNLYNRNQALISFYSGLQVSQFKDEADKLNDLPSDDRFIASRLLFARWAEVDPASALAYTRQMRSGRGLEGFAASNLVMQSWATRQPKEAAKYLDEYEWLFIGSTFAKNPDGSSQTSTAGCIAGEWARQNFSEAISWAQNLKRAFQGDAIRAIVEPLIEKDPSKGSEVLSSITNEEAHNDAVGIIARQLTKGDPAAAADWILANGSEEAQQKSIGGVISTWADEDFEAASEFINRQPEGMMRDQATAALIKANYGDDMAENLKLAEAIQDSETRSRVAGRAVLEWSRLDKESAMNYLETTTLFNEKDKELIKSTLVRYNRIMERRALEQ